MKSIYKIFLLFIAISLASSCDKDFLNIADPNNPTGETFYNSLNNAQMALNGAYAGFNDEYLYFGEMFYILLNTTGEVRHVHPTPYRAQFNDYSFSPDNLLITGYYHGWYRMITRTNDVIKGVNRMIDSGDYGADEIKQLQYMKGQSYFLRGLAYSFLIRSFGEKMPSHPSYSPDLPGVIITDTIITSNDQLYKDRNSVGQVYNFIVEDFKRAESLLPVSWPPAETGKATRGAAQAFLGETYVFLQEWEKAKTEFEKVIQNSNYSLVKNFSHNFDYENIHNSESIFEIGFNNWTIGFWGTYIFRLFAAQSWGTTGIPQSTIDRFGARVEISSQALENALKRKDGVFGRVPKGYVDQLIALATPLIGNTYESKEAFLAAIDDQTNIPFYQEDGVTFSRGVAEFLDAVVPKEPRFAHTFYTPVLDTIVTFNNSARTWNRSAFGSSYGIKKHIPDSVEVEKAQDAGFGNDGHMSMNFRIMRLDDVYLYYAEVMHKLGNDVMAIEYINKIVRRAHGYPVHSPSPVDKNPSDVMAEIRNQTFLEFCLEGKMFFHNRRWNRAAIEWGHLGFQENKHEALPIPQYEMDRNYGITKQNIGY